MFAPISTKSTNISIEHVLSSYGIAILGLGAGIGEVGKLVFTYLLLNTGPSTDLDYENIRVPLVYVLHLGIANLESIHTNFSAYISS